MSTKSKTVWVWNPNIPKSGQATLSFRVAQKKLERYKCHSNANNGQLQELRLCNGKKNHVVYIMKTFKSMTAEYTLQVHTYVTKQLHIFLSYVSGITLVYLQYITPLKTFKANATRELFFNTAFIS